MQFLYVFVENYLDIGKKIGVNNQSVLGKVLIFQLLPYSFTFI